MVKVLVGKKHGDRYPGFWAKFEGEEVSSYKDTRGDRDIVYTLYKCTAYHFDAYRVHIADESKPDAPVYELRPYDPQSVSQGIGYDYSGPYQKHDIEARSPLFLEDMDHFPERNVDPGPSPWSTGQP